MMRKNWLCRLLCVLLTLALAVPAFAEGLPESTPVESPAATTTEAPAGEPAANTEASAEGENVAETAQAPVEIPLEAKVLDLSLRPVSVTKGENASVTVTACDTFKTDNTRMVSDNTVTTPPCLDRIESAVGQTSRQARPAGRCVAD